MAKLTNRPLLLLILVGMAIRLVLAVSYGDHVAARSGAADEVSYDELGQRLASGHGLTFPRPWYPFTAANEPTAHWSYLYALYLGAVYWLLGHHPLAARLFQVAASGVCVWWTYRLAALLFERRVAWMAAAAASLYAYFAFFAAVLMTQTFFILALLVAMERAVLLARRESDSWAALGIALGLGVLLRQTLLLFAPFLLLWCVWWRGGAASWRGAVGAALCIAALVLPWTLRNYLVFGDFLLLNSNAGFFLYASNHPDQGVDFDPTFVPVLPAEIRGLGEPAADRALLRGALAFVRDDPMRFLRLSASRLGKYFWIWPSRHSSWLSNLGRMVSLPLYLPFILYGLWLSRQRWRWCLPLYSYIAFESALHLCSWAAPRYRLPSDALAMVFAGLGAATLNARLAARGEPVVER